MGLGETILLYLLVGAAVAVATLLRDDDRSVRNLAMAVPLAWLFWPLCLPVLLSPGKRASIVRGGSPRAVDDEMTAAIDQVETELDAALSSLGGWAEDALAGEEGRLAELRQALRAQAARVREMDQLLASEGGLPGTMAVADDFPMASRLERSERSRLENLARLREARRQSHADLMATLAWIRELVSMIHLAKFTGAPASRAEELVAQIAAAVEGLSAVAWSESLELRESRSGIPSSLRTTPGLGEQTWDCFNAPPTSSLPT